MIDGVVKHCVLRLNGLCVGLVKSVVVNEFDHLGDDCGVGFFERALKNFARSRSRLSVGIHDSRANILSDGLSGGRVAFVVVDDVKEIIALLLRGKSVAEFDKLNLRDSLLSVLVAHRLKLIPHRINRRQVAGDVNSSVARDQNS